MTPYIDWEVFMAGGLRGPSKHNNAWRVYKLRGYRPHTDCKPPVGALARRSFQEGGCAYIT